MSIVSIVSGLIKPVSDIIDKVVVDKDARAQAKVDLARLEIEMTDKVEERIHEQMLAQIDVNKTEASHKSMLVAGWRPAVGWIGAAGMGYSFVIMPLISWIANVVFKYTGDFPALETEALLFMLSGMLGFGGLRTWEKVKGVSSNVMADNAAATRNVPVAQGVPLDEATIKRITTPRPYGQPLPEDAPWKK